MIKRRLYLQIYATIIASLVAVVLISGLVFSLFGREKLERSVLEVTSKLVWLNLPSANTPQAKQQHAVERLGKELEIEISLFSANRKLIASFGRPSPPPEHGGSYRRGWHPKKHGSSWVLRLPDDRLIVANFERRGPRYPVIFMLGYLVLISLAVLVVAYPFVRKLTRRLETLQRGVERIGSGDLSARIKVKGKDEVASLARSFNDAATKIERLVQSNKLLLANASHELRTPLARIRLGVEMIKTGSDTKRHTALQKDIAELDGLIDEILLMSRLDATSRPKMGDNVDLLALVAEECAHYKGCALEGVPATINGDAKLLQRMVRNLLDNAAKHGAPPIIVKLSTHDNTIQLAISDGGSGILEKDRSHVFEPFYRSSGKQNVEGYGLGLALVKQIAIAHGGKVEIVSGPDSEILVTLPQISAPGPQ